MRTTRSTATRRGARGLLPLLPLVLTLLPLLAQAWPAAAAGSPPPPPPPIPAPTVAPSATPTLTAPSSGTSLTLSPTHGMTNTAIAVSGDGFTRGGQVRLQWDGSGGDLAAATPDGSGHFFTNITIPGDATVGGHQIVAANGTQTAYAPVSVDRAGTSTNSPDDGWCVDLFGAHFCIPTPSSIVYGLANNRLVAE